MAVAHEEPIRLAGAFPFEIVERAGGGATSEVFRARDLRTGKLVALKIGRHADAASLLAREADRLAHTRSPFLPQLIDLGFVPEGTFAGAPFLALSFTEGQSLDVLVERGLEERQALSLTVARDIGEALAALHEAGFAHGDVKPANIVVRAEAHGALRAGLVDFGLAEDADLRSPLGGTPRYLPPETWASADTGDGRSRDRLALGIVLAEILNPAIAHADDALEAARSATFPAPFDRLCPALLALAPGARPRASWVARESARALGESPSAQDEFSRSRHAVRATYLASRRAEIAHAARSEEAEVRVRGEVGAWLSEAIALLRKCARMRGEALSSSPVVVLDADELAKARWLLALVGPAAASWPIAALAPSDDATLGQALLELAGNRHPAAWELGLLERALTGGTIEAAAAPTTLPSEPVVRAARLALLLAASPPDRGAIEEVERHRGPKELVRAAADALRRLGENGRALALSKDDSSVEGLVLRAEVARRAGEMELGTKLAKEALAQCPENDGAAATLSRIQLDSRDFEAALVTLDASSRTAKTTEVRALFALLRGERELALREVSFGQAMANTDEARARLAGLAGYLAHAGGDAPRALDAFAKAAEHAARASALVEEATYRTGEAAAAADCGHLEAALSASRRASLLWEHLGRPADAARALLARAAVFAAAGAKLEACATAREARERARTAGDLRAEAFAHWPVTDVLEKGAELAASAAREAWKLLEEAPQSRATDEDRLRALSRLLRHAPEDVSLERLASADELASKDSCLASARFEWWGARAQSAAEGFVGRPDAFVREIVRLVDAPASLASRGPALSEAVKLAARLGDGDSVRLLVRAQSEAARKLLEHAPPSLRETIATLPWVSEAHALETPGVSAEQLTDIESLVRALGTRDRLRPLLEQVLDSLILWTGVERGLLLLVAPGGRLVPRAARNLQRADLEGEQRALSQSLAHRAMELREPVVAVDASGELSNVHASVMALKLRSVLAVPLLARGEVLGVAYLDDRVRKGAFGPKELAWVRLVASLAAVAIADARDQLLLRRAARKAKRAQQKLSEELARREAALEVATIELLRTQRKETRYRYDAIVGKSEPIRSMLALLDRVTPTSVPVLLIGESGSGKELVARALHENGPRKKQTFVGENCGAIPEALLESTLFGHVRGAFTGADRPRAGLFEIADKGTLFLDEIGEMPLTMQTKLLRVLETGEVRPVGGERGRKVDVRIIAATHRDLREMVQDGRFREDLFYRLDVITVRIPPLRERIDDIPLLVSHMLDKHAHGERVRVSKEAMKLLMAYPWPGNVRQLENEVRRALVLSDGLIAPDHLSREVREGGTSQKERELGMNLRARVDALSTELLQKALAQTKGNQTRAAELLGLSRFGLQKMMKRLDVEV